MKFHTYTPCLSLGSRALQPSTTQQQTHRQHTPHHCLTRTLLSTKLQYNSSLSYHKNLDLFCMFANLSTKLCLSYLNSKLCHNV